MSFDDGIGDELADGDFSRKFDVLLDGLDFADLCNMAGVDYSTAWESVMRGSAGFPGTVPTLQRLLSVLGVDLSYLLNPLPAELRSLTDQRRAARIRIWQFCERYDVPSHHRRALVNYLLAQISESPSHTIRVAARNAARRTMLDLSYEYQRLLKQGYFDDPQR